LIVFNPLTAKNHILCCDLGCLELGMVMRLCWTCRGWGSVRVEIEIGVVHEWARMELGLGMLCG